ncbi:MAG: Ig-like domain-containing protein [Clostridia bacterium]|nr:Ig-like domain-containing protein [Clostridia bacterium]
MSGKLIAFTVAFVLLLACFAPMGVSAESEKLIFDLDLTGSADGSIKVSNSVEGSSTTYDVTSAPPTGTINGNPYLIFRQFKADGTVDNTNQNKYIKVMDESFGNNNEMSIEFWARPQCMNNNQNGKASYRMAALAVGGGSAADNRLDIFCNGSNMYYRPGGEGATTNYEMHSKLWNLNLNEQWTHFVFTRVWNPKSADNPSVGKWTGKVYVNGKQIVAAGIKENETTRTDEDNLYFIIGNQHYLKSAFMGDIADAKIYATALSDTSIAAKYEAEKRNFVTYPNTLEVEDISAKGDTLDEMEGSITLTFNNYLDVSTVEKGISFTRADGTPIGGGAYVSADSDFTNQVKIAFGKLETGETYSLNISEALKSINGKAYSGQNSYVFGVRKGYLFYEDFMGEEYTVGENPYLGGVLDYTSSDVAGSAENITVCGDESFRYISMTGGGTVNKNSRITLNFENEISDDAFVMDLKIRPASMGTAPNDNTPRDVLTVKGPSASVRLANMRYGYLEANTTPGAAASLVGDVNFTETDENGFYDARIIFEKNNDGNYIMTLKNANAENEGEAVFTTNNIGSIKSIELSHLYPLDDTQATMVSADIAKIAISKLIVPKIIYNNFGELERAEDTVKIVFNDTLSGDTVDANTFMLVAPDGENVNTEFGGYDEETRTATLILRDYLEPSTEYTLCVGEAKAVSGLIMREAEYTLVSKAAEVEAKDAVISVETVENVAWVKGSANVVNNSPNDVTAVLMMYASDGRILGFAKSMDNESSGTVTVRAELPEGTKTVKMMIWIEKNGGAVSVMTPVVLSNVN